jgi:tetratricopeptide (TPR) repeat protein
VSTGLTVGLLALLFVIGPATVIAIRSEQLAARRHEVARSEALLAQQAAVHELQTGQVELRMRFAGTAPRAEALERLEGVLARYGVGADPGWAERPGMRPLSDEQQAELRREFGGALLLMASAELASRPAGDPAAAAAALKWNRLAEDCFPRDSRPRMLATQRQRLVKLLPGSAPLIAEPPATADDVYYDACELDANRNPGGALAKLMPFTDDHPGHVLAWALRGTCHDQVAQYGEAAAAYTVCLSLWPDAAWAHFGRGLVRLRHQKYSEADADFTRTLSRKPHWTEARVSRAIARHQVGDYAGAEADLTTALGQPNAPTRLYFLRSRAREALGNKAGAEADAAEGLWREPTDVDSWTTRGFWRYRTDPAGALADYEAALKLSPQSNVVMRDKAVILADHLKRPAEAIAVLDTLLDLYPYATESRATRAVIFARIGEAKRAQEDLVIVLKEEPAPRRLYQAACVYALLSKTDPGGAYRQEALQYMAKAFHGGYSNFDMIARDPDMDPLRDDPDFKEMVQHSKSRQHTRFIPAKTTQP